MNNLVSVYIPTHNRAQLVQRAIESVLAQSYANLEIIVSDDGSSDNTPEVMAAYVEKHANIKYVRSETPQGACHARNCAIELASGDYITGLDDDDYFEKDRVETFMSHKDLLEQFSFICSSYCYQQSESNSRVIMGNDDTIGLDQILTENSVGNQIFTYTQRLRDISGFDKSLKAWQDHEMWLRMIVEYGEAKRVNSPSYVIDVSHQHERISKNINKIKSACEHFIAKYGELYAANNLTDKLKSNVYAYSGYSPSLSEYKTYIKARGFSSAAKLVVKKILKK